MELNLDSHIELSLCGASSDDVQSCSVQSDLMGCSRAGVSKAIPPFLLGEQHYSMEGGLHVGCAELE